MSDAVTSKSRQPTHRLYAITRKEGAAKDDRSFWQPIGAAWAHADSKGMSLKIALLPLRDAELVLRSIDAAATGSSAAATE